MTAYCSAAWGTEHSMAGGAESFVTQDTYCSVAWGAEGPVVGCAEYFGGAFLVSSAYNHPSLLCALPHSCK